MGKEVFVTVLGRVLNIKDEEFSHLYFDLMPDPHI